MSQISRFELTPPIMVIKDITTINNDSRCDLLGSGVILE